jgi:hypothetical protein
MRDANTREKTGGLKGVTKIPLNPPLLKWEAVLIPFTPLHNETSIYQGC